MVELVHLHKVHRFPLHEWGYEGFEKLDGHPEYNIIGHVQVFSQNMRKKRVIPYTALTHWDYVFAIWDVIDNRWWRIGQINRFCKRRKLGFTPVIRITEDVISIEEIMELLELPSHFNFDHKMEGVVVTNQTIRLQGKAINSLYDDTANNVELMKQDRGENVLEVR